MALPEDPLHLSTDELAEYERQLKELSSPYFHETVKCGNPLTIRVIVKVTYGRINKLRRLYCEAHDTLVSLSGWEIGHHGGE